jgi:molecular chaperone GrpE
VAEVVQAGYVIGDRVLRPAMVGVTKGGPKPVAANAGNDNAAGKAESQAADDPTG